MQKHRRKNSDDTMELNQHFFKYGSGLCAPELTEIAELKQSFHLKLKKKKNPTAGEIEL